MPVVPTSYNGRGSALQVSTDGVAFTPLVQLTQFAPTGSKQAHVDQTNILTPTNQVLPLAVRADAGEIDCQGKLNPQDVVTQLLGTLHANLTLAWFRVYLTDGTRYSFQAYVTEWRPFGVRVGKVLDYSFKLRLATSSLAVPS